MVKVKHEQCSLCHTEKPQQDLLKIEGNRFCFSCHKQAIKETLKKEGKPLKFKCEECGKSHPTVLKQRAKNQNVCPTCFFIWRRDVAHMKLLTDFIWEQQGQDKDKLTAATTLVKKYVEEYGYSYNGIRLTLKYFVNHKGGSIKNGIGIVPYYYSEARDFYNECQELKEEAKKLTQIEPRKKIVKAQKLPEHKPKLKLLTMDMGDLEV